MSESSLAAKFKSELRKYCPGSKVILIPENPNLFVMVFPVSVTQIPIYFEKIAKVITKFSETGIVIDKTTGLPTDAGLQKILATLSQLVMEDLLDLVDACCVPRMTELDLPHHMIPPIVTAWIAENFLGERLNPWKRAMTGMFEKLTGKSLSLLDMLSKRSSPADINSPTSSTNGNQDFPTEDGVTSNSGVS